ncbi:SOS response-associated peptidase [Pseudomonas sp. BN414]|uniref:SOS response-associated peptidase n=1 Tax=Pseudomonas sp. BN414 TaxID=2567888 RepID=UPI002454DFD9|nr:SOS response-associated peptidase [Pseudomonas sp. BN414]MDH4566197.1 SOS response-associated peptidase [Pseudomonas sp. BN414]
MCGRYVTPSDRAIEDFWHIGARDSGRWVQSFNAAPTTQVPILRLDHGGEAELVTARWGLIPFWWKQPKPPSLSFNARSEEAAKKPMWRSSLQRQRCIMPAQGWYEWNEHQRVRNRAGLLVNQPYYHHAANNEVLAIAGLWATWTGPEGQEVVTCALLTKDAAGPAADIHHRMPVILRPEQFDIWLSPSTSAEQVHSTIAISREDFAAHPVTTDVGNNRNDSPELLEPVVVVLAD